ncbi:glutathione S-transferase C-terminal domain-containing protein [Thioclava litoralis]|uniref:Glutathione S-transferase C-terminal domain-containing protein n=1 Tax=Thioclava litoralis TaxID=3076557 RepID=A0ABZ1E170_9RHOB|nr:glutathione S-transferase C-terminal domain-containing protein [Thioclava sp. FTW29]
MLVDGTWTEDWQPVQKSDDKGRFVRQVSGFRNWITPDGSAGPTGQGGYKAEAGRYRLYVAYICPWASRTLMARKLKKLEAFIEVTVVNPRLGDQGWEFGGFQRAEADPLHGATYLHELYTRADPQYTGRATVPVLWDMKTDSLVNNESADIVRMFDAAFEGLAPETPCLRPEDIETEISKASARIYDAYNNGVYKAGFASSQAAYDEAVAGVFAEMDRMEAVLSDGRPWFHGDRLTETDIRIFVTSIRFDVAYHGLFKTNLKMLRDYPALYAHMVRMLNQPGVAGTVDLDHIKAGYYAIKRLNPPRIVPKGPEDSYRLLAEARGR